MPPTLQRALEKELKGQQELNALKKEHTKQLLKEVSALENIEARHRRLKEAVEEHKKIFDAVADELKGTTKNAKEYGKAIVKDTEMVKEFAKTHKISLDQALEMYKKVREERKSFWSEHKDQIKTALSGALTAVSVTAAYQKRIEEITEGQRLFATSVSLTSANFKETANYVEGYRQAMRSARDITKEFGVETSDAEGTIKAVAYSIRNTVTDSSQLGAQTLKTTRALYGMSRMLGIEVSDALQAYRDEMLVHGKTNEEALKSLDTTTAAYDEMSKRVRKAVLPFKEDFFGALRDVKQELGPVSVNTLALNAAMVRMAEGASKAGLSTQSVVDSMKALPKMMKGLPAYYQYTIGRNFLGQVRRDFDPKTGIWSGAMSSLPDELKKQMKSVESMNIPDFMKSQMAYDVMIGSDKGIEAVIKTMQGIDPTRRLAMLRQMGLSTQDILATNEMFKGGELGTKEIQKLKQQITEGQKKTVDVREALKKSMDENMSATDRSVKALRDSIETMLKLKDSNIELLAGVGLLTTAMQSSMLKGLLSSIANLGKGGGLPGTAGAGGLGAQSVTSLAKGGLGGLVKLTAGVLGAGAFGWAIGTMIDKQFGISDKLSNWLTKGDKEDSKKRVESHTKNITLKNAEEQAKMFANLAKNNRYIDVRNKQGKIEKQELTRGLAEKRIATFLQRQGKTDAEQRKIIENLAPHLKNIPTKDQLRERQNMGAALTPEKQVAGRMNAEAALGDRVTKTTDALGGNKKASQVQFDPAMKQVTFNLADLAMPFQELQQMSIAQNPKSR